MGDNISDLPGAIRRAWEALLPAIFQSISAVVCVAYVLDWREVVAAIRPVARSLLNPPSAMAQETIKLYGLSAVIPFALVVTSIALTQAVSRVVSWLGERAPGHLRQNSTVTFFEVLREQDFHRMLQYFPNIRDLSNIRDLMDLNMIDAIIERDIRAAQNSPTAPVQFGWALWAKQQVSRVTSLADFVKGLLVIAWASWLLGPWFLQAP